MYCLWIARKSSLLSGNLGDFPIVFVESRELVDVENGSVFASKSQLELATRITKNRIFETFFINGLSKSVAL